MRTMGLFAGLCTDVMIIRFTLRLLVACLTTENKQVPVASYVDMATVEPHLRIF